MVVKPGPTCTVLYLLLLAHTHTVGASGVFCMQPTVTGGVWWDGRWRQLGRYPSPSIGEAFHSRIGEHRRGKKPSMDDLPPPSGDAA